MLNRRLGTTSFPGRVPHLFPTVLEVRLEYLVKPYDLSRSAEAVSIASTSLSPDKAAVPRLSHHVLKVPLRYCLPFRSISKEYKPIFAVDRYCWTGTVSMGPPDPGSLRAKRVIGASITVVEGK